jgi:hypothetical protein
MEGREESHSSKRAQIAERAPKIRNTGDRKAKVAKAAEPAAVNQPVRAYHREGKNVSTHGSMSSGYSHHFTPSM